MKTHPRMIALALAVLAWTASQANVAPAIPGAQTEPPQSTNKMVLKAVSPQTNYLATASDNGLLAVRRLSDNRMLWSSYHCSASAMAFSADGETLATAGRDRTGVSTIRLWDAQDGARLFTFTNHREQVRVLLFEESGCLLVSLDNSGLLECWNLSDGTSLWSRSGLGAVHSLSRSSDGSSLICEWSTPKSSASQMGLRCRNTGSTTAPPAHRGGRRGVAGLNADAIIRRGRQNLIARQT